ncbi:hypothetical protein EB118_02130 [bacterium]|nr:hypothetical protein [bacterium]NDC93909.1 hypothetical protein [bacterium]NDD83258.1 hypothetical protein [bacterium]NDG28886.1 hypothetical protein [bacterium]
MYLNNSVVRTNEKASDVSGQSMYLNNSVVQTNAIDNVPRYNSTFILVSYYWGHNVVNKGSVHGLTYSQQVDRLIGNCERLEINYYFVWVKQFEDTKYQAALSYKPDFIQWCLDIFPNHKCIFVDTDLQILKYPHLFEVDADCWFVNWNEYDYGCYNPFQLVLPGAILGFANTHAARAMLKILTDFMHMHSFLAEDKSFSGIISRHFLNVYLRCVWLPESYMYMFERHKYSPELGKYTFVADIDYEMRRGTYSKDDLVMIHEDFETGNLDDIYKKRVGRSRFPPNFNRQQGEKLRCFDVIFRNYTTFGLTPRQAEEYRTDWKHKERNGIYRNKPVPEGKVVDILPLASEKFGSPFLLVTQVDDLVEATDFIDSAREFKMDYTVYKTQKNYSLYTMLRICLIENKRDIRYVSSKAQIRKRPDAFWINNMDFISPNLNVMYTLSKCSDPRVLSLPGDFIYGFSYNQRILEFLAIVESFVRPRHILFQHKIFEYVFNVSLAVNKLRCWWVDKSYLTNVIRVTQSQIRAQVPKKYTRVTKKLKQCGIKPSLNADSDPLPTHYFGSRSSNIFHNRYGKKFITYYNA